jgi:nucleoside-diphosphate-sugar epimerase
VKNKTILLIGGAGYIGTVLTEHFLSLGCKVKCLDVFLYGNNTCITPYISNPDYSFIYGDMADPVAMYRAKKDVTDVVLLAGMVGDPITRLYPNEAKAINNVGIKKCIDLLSDSDINKLIYTSSCSNYGMRNNDLPASETEELNPTSSYAQDKIDTEKYLLSSKGKVGFSPTILRVATAFGMSTRLRLDLTINEFTYYAATEKKLSIFNPIAWRPYCHVKDFAKLVELVISSPVETTDFQVFNGGNDQNNLTKQDIINILLKYVPDLEVTYDNQYTDPRNYKVSFEKAKSVLGFKAEYDVEFGIKEVINAINSHIYDNIDPKSTIYGNYNITYEQRT